MNDAATAEQPARGHDGGPVRVGLLMDGSEAGGVLYSTRLLLENLDRRVVRITGVFMGESGSRDALAACCDETVDLHAGCLLPLTRPGRGRLDPMNIADKGVRFGRAALRLTALIRRSRLDVVHVNYYPLHFVAGIACRLTGTPCLWHWRGVTERRGVYAWVVGLGFRHFATRIPCISGFVADSLTPAGRRKACVVYNGVPTRKIRAEQRRGVLRARARIPLDVPLVGVFGWLTEYKGHEYFLRAAVEVVEQVPAAHFVVVGGESDVQRSRFAREATLRKLACELGVHERVHFTGHLPDARLLMSDCDVICMPTIPEGIAGEGFGLAMVEAMAAGVATVATTCGAPPEVIEDSTSGLLVAPRDAGGLARAIVRLLRDATFRQAVAEAGRRRVAERFDIARTARAMERLYTECSRARRTGQRAGWSSTACDAACPGSHRSGAT